MKKIKLERRDMIAAGGLAAFGAGFSQTLGRMADSVLAPAPERDKVHGRSPEPEYRVDPATGAVTLNPDQQVSYTGCLGCTTLCGVRVRIDKKSGRILRVAGNPYNPLSTDPHLPMGKSVKDSLLSLSRHQDKGLAGRSTACGRGNAALDQMNSPFRVLGPLKRVGPRNGGRWEPISFEQLVKEVVEGGDLFGEGHVDGLAALRELQAPISADSPEFGPRVNQVGVLTSVNDGREALGRRFWNQAYGTLNFAGHGSYCGGAYRSGSGALFGDMKGMPHAKPDLAHAEFVIFVGTAPGNAGNPFKRTGALLAKARSEGQLDYVVVDPVLNNSDNRATGDRGRWIPIRPNADGALAMGMMRWMFEQQRVNTAYLAYPNLEAAQAAGEPSFTNASWLVIHAPGHPRHGALLRGSDIGLDVAEADRGKDADPYLVRGPGDRPVDAARFAGPAPLAATGMTVMLGDQPVELRTGLELLQASAMRLSLADCAARCGIPEATIAGLADEFTRHGRKASVVAHGGMMGGNGFYNAYSLMTLNALIGNLNCKGGFVINGGGFKDAGEGPRYNLASFPGQVKPGGMPLGRNVPYERTSEFKRAKANGRPYPARDQWFPNAPGLVTEWLTAAMRGYPYGLKALVLWMANPLYGVPGLRPLIEKDLADPKKLPLIIAVDPLINETNAFADYIVPDAMMYETWGWTGAWNGVPTKSMTARWPVVEPRTHKTADGQPLCMDSFVIALARAMDLPGFGPQGLSDMDGQPLPLECAEDWYLRGGANIAWLGKAPVGDATDEDIACSGVTRLLPQLQRVLKEEEWRKVAFLYTRGGRYQPASEAQDAEHPDWQAHRFQKPLWIWNDNLARARHSLTGRAFPGCASWHEPAFGDGTPLRQVHTEADWPLLLVSFKSALHNSYSIATRLTLLHADNPALLHPEDARRAGLRSGDTARIATPGGEARCTVIVHEGVMRGVVAIEHGFGHRELGARAHRLGDREQPRRPELRAGMNLNDVGLADPTRRGEVVWVDAVSGTSVRQGLPARIRRA